MNQRVNKKIHKRYLSDIGIEIPNSSDWEDRLSTLDIHETRDIKDSEIPDSFHELNESAKNYNLEYIVKRLKLEEIPYSESGWWHTDNDTKYYVFYPKCAEQVKWYVATNYKNQP